MLTAWFLDVPPPTWWGDAGHCHALARDGDRVHLLTEVALFTMSDNALRDLAQHPRGHLTAVAELLAQYAVGVETDFVRRETERDTPVPSGVDGVRLMRLRVDDGVFHALTWPLDHHYAFVALAGDTLLSGVVPNDADLVLATFT